MKSSRSKVLHGLFGKPLVDYAVESAAGLHPERTLLVAGANRRELAPLYSGRAEIVLQSRRLGTGHAVMCCRPKLRRFEGDLLVLPGDAPLVRRQTLSELLSRHRKAKAHASFLTSYADEPHGYGRILRDSSGRVTGIREEVEASDSEKNIKEVNSGVYLFDTGCLFEVLDEIRPSRRKGEYYLTDAIEVLARNGRQVDAYPLAESGELMGINTREDLAVAWQEMGKRNVQYHLERGVTIVLPENTFIEADVQIGADTIIYPFSYIEKGVKIGKGCSLGPFAKIRSGSTIRDGAIIGSFVEIVRSSIGKGSLVKHLTYLGDTEVGEKVNIGAGTITANFDGKKKCRTRIGDRAFVGCDTILVAPVSVGRGARTGAGSVILSGKDVPAKATAVGVPAHILVRKRREKEKSKTSKG